MSVHGGQQIGDNLLTRRLILYSDGKDINIQYQTRPF
jgi:hypothetical protein